MSEERENEKAAVSIDHFSHRHLLTLTKIHKKHGIDYEIIKRIFGEGCYGCKRRINYQREKAYKCREGCSYPIFHEECAEMPRIIRLSMHPQHTLIQKEVKITSKCAVCEEYIHHIGYCCVHEDECRFQVHVGCAHNMEVPQVRINHPSHPQHQLSFFNRPGRSCVLRCDACGTIERGNYYVCSGCQYWIHESCARLSPTEHFKHHHHPLSLIYHLPIEYIKYIKFDAKCDICLEDLLARYWVYHCEICRYVVHIKCAVKDKDVIYFPIKDVVKELIIYFVTKVGGVTANRNEMVNREYKFHNHDHQLYLTSSSLHDPEEVDDDDDDFYCGDKSGLVCDGCTMQIFPKKQQSSIEEKEGDDVDDDVVDFMSCGECKYFLHSACFHLPPQIPSHPLHPDRHHNLTLQTCPKLDFVCCDICRIYTNGLYYGCTKCYFKVDIKCASLPNTIRHAAHFQHHLELVNLDFKIHSYDIRLCYACGGDISRYVCYRCDICEFILHSFCALLPAVVANPRWDKHPLRLTFNISVKNRGSFYCQVCEEEMDPKMWMYHCQDCDNFIHPKCSPTALGEHRNIKFGQRYDVGSLHHHPVALQLLTKKLHCDVCGQRKDYGCKGLQCVLDKCKFFMCFDPCYGNHRAKIKVLIEETSSSDH